MPFEVNAFLSAYSNKIWTARLGEKNIIKFSDCWSLWLIGQVSVMFVGGRGGGQKFGVQTGPLL